MKTTTLFAALAAALLILPLHADVKLPVIFGDHMVLQQGATLPVWGTAASGEKVTVTIGTDSATATAKADGSWRVDLKPLPTTATGTTLTVAGTNTITIQDVLVGEVWLASGQSNMERTMSAFVGKPNVVDINKVVADAANRPQIRIFLVPRKATLTPQGDITGASWKVCSPDVVHNSSAVAYFFALALQDKLQRPIGLIDSYWGGMPIKTFTSREALQPTPELKDELAKIDAKRDAWTAMTDAERVTALADFRTKTQAWQADTTGRYKDEAAAWPAAVAAAKAAGQPAPPRPVPLPRPASPEGNNGEPGTIFNAMIYPLIPYAIKGALWYQGETDATGTGELYNALLPALIGDWRKRWAEGDFPFLVVTLANFRGRDAAPSDSAWVRVREAQIKTSEKVPNVAVGEAIDVGEAGSIHPVDKYDVGNRLAAAALHVAYGQDVPWIGPTFAGETIEPGDIRIKFANTGGGLVIGQSPWPADNAPEPTDHVVGFAIAGADQKWLWADAKIEGSDVVVSSAQVTAPVAVRYGWANNPAINLYNKEGFPAAPFRTDDWPLAGPAPARPK